VFFDCDGVIFDSNGFKLDALRHALSGYPAPAIAQMELFWSAHGGMARYPKLEHFFRNILPIDGQSTEDTSMQLHRAAARFGEFARRAFISARPIAEALALARHAGSERCFVVSGADQGELCDIFRDKQLSPLFKEVCGSPTKKLAHVTRILAERHCESRRALLIGDGAIDFQVCQSLGMPFIYLDQHSEWTAAKATLAGAPNVALFDTWPEVLNFLEVGLPSDRVT